MKLFKYFEQFLVYLAKGLLLLMVIITAVTVLTRYAFGYSAPWASEVCTLCMIWFSFIALVIGYRDNAHVRVNYFVALIKSKVIRSYIEMFSIFLTFVVGGWYTYYGWILVARKTSKTLPATGLPVLVEPLVLPIAGVLLAIFATVKLYELFKLKDEISLFDHTKEEKL